jgi:hypothetical protein
MTIVKSYCDCHGFEAGAVVRVRDTGLTYRAVRATAKGESPQAAPSAWERVEIGDGRGTLARGMEARPQ